MATGTSTSSVVGNPAAAGTGAPNAGVIIGAILGTLIGLVSISVSSSPITDNKSVRTLIADGTQCQALLAYCMRKVIPEMKMKNKKLTPWDEANMLQNMKNEEVHVTTAASQRYVYRE